MKLHHGIVAEVDQKTKTGTIRFSSTLEYFFSASECENLEMPQVGTQVTFLRDPDFKSTPVAMQIKKSNLKVG